MNVMGVVSIPGMMTGQILGGTAPAQARPAAAAAALSLGGVRTQHRGLRSAARAGGDECCGRPGQATPRRKAL